MNAQTLWLLTILGAPLGAALLLFLLRERGMRAAGWIAGLAAGLSLVGTFALLPALHRAGTPGLLPGLPVQGDYLLAAVKVKATFVSRQCQRHDPMFLAPAHLACVRPDGQDVSRFLVPRPVAHYAVALLADADFLRSVLGPFGARLYWWRASIHGKMPIKSLSRAERRARHRSAEYE